MDGSITAGIALGLFYGFVFTFLPLFVLTFAVRRRRSWRARAWLIGLAVLLALPNLFTLGIVIGNSSAAHAGERTLDVRAPDFRGATLVGAIFAVAAVVGLRYLLMSRRRAKEREASLRGELRSRDDARQSSRRRIRRADAGRPHLLRLPGQHLPFADRRGRDAPPGGGGRAGGRDPDRERGHGRVARRQPARRPRPRRGPRRGASR